MQADALRQQNANGLGVHGHAPAVPASRCALFCRNLGIIAKVAFKILIGVGLFIVNPSFCLAGFIAGIIFAEHVSQGIRKIIQVWNSQKIIGTLTIGVASYLALPVTLAASALLYSAYWGSRAYLAIRPPVRPQNVILHI